jgi:hypothetical protein
MGQGTKPNVTLAGQGWSTVLQRHPSLNGQVIYSAGAGFTLRNLTIDGNGTVTPPAQFDVEVAGDNSLVEHCRFVNSGGNGSLALHGDNARAMENTITGFGTDLGTERGYGIWAMGEKTVLIHGNTITGTNIDGIGFNGPGGRVTNNRVSGCHCYTGNGGGQIVYYTAPSSRMAIIADNYIGPGGSGAADGIELSGQNCAVIGNTIDGVGGYGVHIAPQSGNITLANGIIRNCGSGAPGLIDGVRIDANVNDIVINGMIITDTQATPTMRNAIRVEPGTSDDIIVTNNILWPVQQNPMVDQGSGTNKVISGNHGIDDGTPSLASAASITLPLNPIISLTGSATVTSVSGFWRGRRGVFIPTGAVVFTAGPTIGNTTTCVAGVPKAFTYDGSRLYLGA